MDNLENQIICNLQYQLDILQKDNLNYLNTISDLENNIDNLENNIDNLENNIDNLENNIDNLENNIDNLKNEIIQKNKEIDKLNDSIKLKEEQCMLNKLDSTESVEPNTPTGLLGTNTSIFRKILNFKF